MLNNSKTAGFRHVDTPFSDTPPPAPLIDSLQFVFNLSLTLLSPAPFLSFLRKFTFLQSPSPPPPQTTITCPFQPPSQARASSALSSPIQPSQPNHHAVPLPPPLNDHDNHAMPKQQQPISSLTATTSPYQPCKLNPLHPNQNPFNSNPPCSQPHREAFTAAPPSTLYNRTHATFKFPAHHHRTTIDLNPPSQMPITSRPQDSPPSSAVMCTCKHQSTKFTTGIQLTLQTQRIFHHRCEGPRPVPLS
ncbi:hypothetical protein M0R45_025735 [Rubus argutus]|uniref:Uncharacterized protein n=1 Tax=Rubus argutus TaxID=59490 RepID=A0AAW1WWW6_RUBAR